MKHLLPLATALTLSTAACAVDAGSDVRADTDDTAEHLGQTAQQVTVISCTGQGFSLLRYYSPAATDHFYTINSAEGANAAGYHLEGTAGTVFSSVFQACGAVPLYRFYNAAGTDHFYTTNFNEGAGLSFEGIPGYCFPSPASGLTPLYRYFSGAAFDHFYTTNFGELGNGAGGYGLEGVQCYVAP